MNYIVRNGESIADVVLNATGNIQNWKVILETNGFSEWTPILHAGQIIIIPDTVIMQPNSKAILDDYPSNNNSKAADLDDQITDLITLIESGPQTYDDFFLPSKDELLAMRTELYDYGVGGFMGGNPALDKYWSSSEYTLNTAWWYPFPGSVTAFLKSDTWFVRACRAFTSTINYNLRDIGPAGGLIFAIIGSTYYEAAPSDQSASQEWSNIHATLIGTTGTAIGTGQANTTAIINQAGHTTSAAKLCADLVIIR